MWISQGTIGRLDGRLDGLIGLPPSDGRITIIPVWSTLGRLDGRLDG